MPPVVEAARNGDVRGLRVGVVRELTGEGYQAGVQQRFDEAVELLRDLGAEVVEVSCPHFPYALAAYYLILPSEASSNLAKFDGMRFGLRVGDDGTSTTEQVMARTRAAGFGDEVVRRIILGTYALSAGYYDAYYGSAQKVRTLVQRDFAAAFESVDVLVSPTAPTTAFKFGEKLDDPLAMYLNDVAHHPGQPRRHAGPVAAGRARAGGRPAGGPAGDGAGARRRPALPGRGRARGCAAGALGRPDPGRRPGARGRVPHDRVHGGGVLLVDFDDVVGRYDPVLGLEVHVELNTATKMFCGCATAFGAEPNTHTCPTCLGLPGSLPVVNAVAVESAIRIGLALNCTIARVVPVRAEELLLPGHAEELPDLAVRRADRVRRLDRRRRADRRRAADVPDRDRARAHGGGHRQVAARRRRRPAASTAPTTPWSTTTAPASR